MVQQAYATHDDASFALSVGEAAGGPPLEIEALGTLHLRVGDDDHAGALLCHPVQSRLWLYLLARQARQPGDRITRDALADRLYPTLSQPQRRLRLRKRLHEQCRLPQPLRRVRLERAYVWLDLSGCEFDVYRVFTVARLAWEIVANDEAITPTLLKRVQAALQASARPFLSCWEESGLEVTDKRQTADGVIGEVRQRISEARSTMLMALAAFYLGRRQPAQAFPYLEELRHRPDDVGLALKLVAAYEAGGQVRMGCDMGRHDAG